MLKVGLTGGIGSGKSTVAGLFAQHGCPIIDADVIAHTLVEPGQPALAAIRQAFGEEIMDGAALNRKKLGDIVFTYPLQKQRLEAILHPLIRTAIQAQVQQCHGAYCIIVVPLLIEAGMTDLVDRIVLVDCPETMQIQRVQQRDNLPPAKIQAIMANQASRAERVRIADDIIDNAFPDAALAEQVKKLHNHYLSLSTSRDNFTCEQQNHL
ncbi:MAG: dephospho-CoA kinase [Methylobacter sp.]|nr:MAG: dephospho-CoA kinase [Methylobacter sp.]